MDKYALIKGLKMLAEATMDDFAAQVDGGRRSRATKLQHHYRDIVQANDGNAIIRWSIPSQSNPDKAYRCYIEVIPKNTTLFALSKGTRKIGDRINALKNADVKCFCSCPDFNWSGMRYNMKHKHDSIVDGQQSDDGIPNGEDIAPNVRDPERKKTVCKHILAAFKGCATNAGRIMKDVSQFKVSVPETTPSDILTTKENDTAPSQKTGIATTPEVEADDAKASGILENTEASRIPEAQEALDALASTMPDTTDVEDKPVEPSGIMPTDAEQHLEDDEPNMDILSTPGDEDIPKIGTEDDDLLDMFDKELPD